MKLTRNCKVVLDAAIAHEPDLINNFYSVPKVANCTQKLSESIVQEVCESLAEEHYIRWGDDQHTAFRLTEIGRSYRELYLGEWLERTFDRIWGFVTGILAGVILFWITG